jgi:hypothetical protein
MEIILTIWGAGIMYCIYDAIFCAGLDPESEKEFKSRENVNKSTS